MAFIFCQVPIPMVMSTAKKVTDFGEKPGLITILFSSAKVLMETEIGIIIGQKPVPVVTNALKLTTGLKPFLKLKPKMFAIMFWLLNPYQFWHNAFIVTHNFGCGLLVMKMVVLTQKMLTKFVVLLMMLSRLLRLSMEQFLKTSTLPISIPLLEPVTIGTKEF